MNTLTDTQLRSIKPTGKMQRFYDGGGLYLLANPNGAKWWRFDYTFNGKRKTLSLGVYPKVSLAMVRIKANAARVELANGVNPSDSRKANKQAIKTTLENERRLKDGLAIIGSFEYVAMP